VHFVYVEPGGERSNHWALKGYLWFLVCRILAETEKHRVRIIVLILICCVCITTAVGNVNCRVYCSFCIMKWTICW